MLTVLLYNLDKTGRNASDELNQTNINNQHQLGQMCGLHPCLNNTGGTPTTPTVQSEKSTETVVAEWLSWGPWGSCSTIRSRRCHGGATEATMCQGNSTELQKCNTKQCMCMPKYYYPFSIE